MFAHHNDTPGILFWTKMTDFCPVAGSVILAREQKHVSHTVLNALKNTVWDAILARKYRSERVSWAYTRASNGIFEWHIPWACTHRGDHEGRPDMVFG
jgi:hypothetical protein